MINWYLKLSKVKNVEKLYKVCKLTLKITAKKCKGHVHIYGHVHLEHEINLQNCKKIKFEKMIKKIVNWH